MKRILFAMLLVAAPAVLRAQTTVHGTVVDRQTGAPVARAQVVVTGTSAGAATNDAGAFSLTFQGGVASLTVTRLGYDTAVVAVTDASQALRIQLVPASVSLPGLEVTALSPTPSVGTLTAADLDRGTGLQLADAINTMPGVFMQSRTPWGGARITIRGYYPSTSGNSPNSNGLGYQVFLDDIPITDATGATVLDDIDYTALGRVEVIKGPASSRYGSAIGGTVNLATAEPTPHQTSFGQETLAGSDGLLRTNTTFETAGDHSDAVVNYGHQAYDSFRPHSASSKDYLRASGDVGVGGSQTVSAYFSYNRSYEDLAGEIDSTPFYQRQAVSNPAYLANDSHIAITGAIAGVTDHARLGDHFTAQTTLFADGRTSAQPFAHGFTDVNQINFGGRSEFGYSGQLGAVGVTGSLGALGQRSNLTTNGVFIVPAPPYPERPTDQENWATAVSLYTEWSFALPARVDVTVGAGLNMNTFSIRNMLGANNQLYDTTTAQTRTFDPALTPRVAVTKQLGGHASVYAGVSTGYTPPLLSNTIASDGTVDLSLKPERAVQYEIGAQGSWMGGRLTAQADLFDVENTDKLVSQTSGSVTFTTNAGKQRDQGFEGSVSYRLVDAPDHGVSLVRPWLSYTWTRSVFVDFKSDNNDDSTTVSFAGNAVPRVPRNMVSAGIDVATGPGFSLHATYQHVDRVPVTFDNTTWVRGYDLLGAKVDFQRMLARHWRLDAAVGGDNLLGSTYYEFLFVGANYKGLAQAADGGTGDGYIIPGPYDATLYGSLSLQFVL